MNGGRSARLAPVLLTWVSGIAAAAGPMSSPDGAPPHEFALRLSQTEVELSYPAALVDTRLQWIGIAWRESYGARVQLGFYGGYSFLTQDNNALTAGQDLDGYHAGLSLHVALLQSRSTGLYLAASYTYQYVKNDEAGQTVRIDLQQPTIELALTQRVGEYVRLYGGGYYAAVDGQQRVSGDLNETLDFERDTRGGGIIGVDLDVGGRGRVGAELRSGLYDTVEVYFKHLF